PQCAAMRGIARFAARLGWYRRCARLYRPLVRGAHAESRLRPRRGAASALAADELQHDLAPMRPGAMLGEIETLPSAEPKFLANHRDVERYADEHCLDVSRHIVRPFDIVHPAGIGGGEPLEGGD